MTGKFEYDPELMEKARWTVDGRLYWPPEHQIECQIERQLDSLLECQLELPLPEPRKP